VFETDNGQLAQRAESRELYGYSTVPVVSYLRYTNSFIIITSACDALASGVTLVINYECYWMCVFRPNKQ